MKHTKGRENETMSKYTDFISQIRDKNQTTGKNSWMNTKLEFKIDSEKAYDVDKAKDYENKIGTGANYESFLSKSK